MTKMHLKPGFILRPATMDDLESVTQLIYDVCLNSGDASIAVTIDEMRETWEDPNLNLETDTWVVTTKDGRVVGYEGFYNWSGHASLLGNGYVHPDFMGKGIGTALLRALDKRAHDEVEKADPALLYQTFGAFYLRGTKKISLGVDAASPTGATRLYKHAGMSVGSEYVSYEKELRPGRNIED